MSQNSYKVKYLGAHMNTAS